MIRDRVVFGTLSSKIREKLINEGEKLTLDKAIQIAPNFEYSREQLKTMAATGDTLQQQGPIHAHAIRKQGARHFLLVLKPLLLNRIINMLKATRNVEIVGHSIADRISVPHTGNSAIIAKNGTIIYLAVVQKRILDKNLCMN